MNFPFINIHTHAESVDDSFRVISVVDNNASTEGLISVGVHPWEVDQVMYDGGSENELMAMVDTRVLSAIESLGLYDGDLCSIGSQHNQQQCGGNIKKPRIIAIGEIGLDYHHARKLLGKDLSLLMTMMKAQRTVFSRQIELANKHSLPIIVHSVKAMDDTIHLLRTYANVAWVWHGFARSSYEMARQILYSDIKSGIGKAAGDEKITTDPISNTYLSFGSRLMHDQGLQNVFSAIDINNVLLETDQDTDWTIEQLYERASSLKRMNHSEFKQHIFNNFLRWSGKNVHSFSWE